MPFLPRVSFAEKRQIAVINQAPPECTFDNLRSVCLGVSTFRYPRHTQEPCKFNEIIPGLFIGEGPLNVPKLQENGVVRVLELGAPKTISVTDQCRNPYKDHGFKYMAIKIEDSENAKISCYFEDCAKFIERGLKQGAVYVFSPCGTSRSSTIVTAFLILHRGMSGVEALRSIHIRKPVKPNDGFLRQLVQLTEDIAKKKNKIASHREVMMDYAKPKPIHAPLVYYRAENSYNISSIGLHRQKVAQKLYFNSEESEKNPITHTSSGNVKPIIFKAM